MIATRDPVVPPQVRYNWTLQTHPPQSHRTSEGTTGSLGLLGTRAYQTSPSQTTETTDPGNRGTEGTRGTLTLNAQRERNEERFWWRSIQMWIWVVFPLMKKFKYRYIYLEYRPRTRSSENGNQYSTCFCCFPCNHACSIF